MRCVALVDRTGWRRHRHFWKNTERRPQTAKRTAMRPAIRTPFSRSLTTSHQDRGKVATDSDSRRRCGDSNWFPILWLGISEMVRRRVCLSWRQTPRWPEPAALRSAGGRLTVAGCEPPGRCAELGRQYALEETTLTICSEDQRGRGTPIGTRSARPPARSRSARWSCRRRERRASVARPHVPGRQRGSSTCGRKHSLAACHGRRGT